MSKKTIRFYTPAEEQQIKDIFTSNTGRDRKTKLEAWGKANDREYGLVYAKGHALTKTKKAITKHSPKAGPASVATVKGSIIRFPFKDINVDMANKEVVIRL